jgi:cytochrome b561
MKIRNTTYSYGLVSKAFHWLLAGLVIYMLYRGYFGLHKTIGITILFLALIRIMWIYTNQKVAYPLTISHQQANLARLMHYSLYTLLIAVPLSGWLLSSAAGKPISFYGFFEIPVILSKNSELRPFFSAVHYWLTRIMIGMVAVHALAALYHFIILRDDILQRMTYRKS